MMHNCGVYQIRNTVNGHVYIGSSRDIQQRWGGHKWDLRNGVHDNEHLQRAWNKYGEDAFVFETILLCDPENRLYYEQVLLDNMKPAYNIAINATANMQGLYMSDAARAKLSESHKGKRHPNFGKHLPEETRVKISKANKGKPNGRLGAHLSEETRAKISEAHKGKFVSGETRRKLSEINTGKHHTSETRAKMSETQKMRWVSRKADEGLSA